MALTIDVCWKVCFSGLVARKTTASRTFRDECVYACVCVFLFNPLQRGTVDFERKASGLGDPAFPFPSREGLVCLVNNYTILSLAQSQPFELLGCLCVLLLFVKIPNNSHRRRQVLVSHSIAILDLLFEFV